MIIEFLCEVHKRNALLWDSICISACFNSKTTGWTTIKLWVWVCIESWVDFILDCTGSP